MATENTGTLQFKVGDWVIVTTPGPYFGKSGQITERAHESVRHKLDWCVMTHGNDGGGFRESELMPDPRFTREPIPEVQDTHVP